MSYTIFTANPTALIAQPGRAVNTFPSGLVRVDQTYLGLTSQSATHRATLAVGNNMPDGDSYPCIDGLKIFPEVQERRREDGFTEFVVSAYGRVNYTGRKASARIVANNLIDFDKSINGTLFQFRSKISLCNKLVSENVVLSSQPVEEQIFSASLADIQLYSISIQSPTNASPGTFTSYQMVASDMSGYTVVNNNWSDRAGYKLNFSAIYQGARINIGEYSFFPDIQVSTDQVNFGAFSEVKRVFNLA